jgi:hypothetical protein
MPSATRRSGALAARRGAAIVVLAFALSALAAGCGGGGLLAPQYEYEEELYLDLDGSAALHLNGSVAALVALRGVDLPVDPLARLDRDRVRALFQQPGADVALSLSRRDGRRFVHVRVEVDDVTALARLQPFSWSTYRVGRRDDTVEYQQAIGASVGRDVGDVGWDGTEMVRFRMHVPSEILFHNSQEQIQRGNILEWAQPLQARLAGEPLELVVQMAPESILYTTLLLFGSTILAAAATFGLVLWWLLRRGRSAGLAESHS